MSEREECGDCGRTEGQGHAPDCIENRVEPPSPAIWAGGMSQIVEPQTPDTCSHCGAPGFRVVDHRGDGSVRFVRAAEPAALAHERQQGREEAAIHVGHTPCCFRPSDHVWADPIRCLEDHQNWPCDAIASPSEEPTPAKENP